MTDFAFGVTVPAQEINSSALGTGSGNIFQSPYDVGKAVNLGTAQNHILAVAGSDIDGFVTSVEAFTVNGGSSFGGVLVEGRILAVVGANQGGTAMAVGNYVVADTQLALGTVGANQTWTAPGTAPSSPTGPTAQVKTGVAGVAGTSFSTPLRKFWRCIRIVSGAGAAGSVVLLERT
jgi:hypothetical protein